MKKDTIAIIPARQNSKRLKNKNLKNFLGKPLIYYSINEAKKSNLISEVVVSTDSKRIAKISEKLGAIVPFLRNKKLSGDKIETIDVINDLYKKYIYKKNSIRQLIILQPTSPLRDYKDINDSIKFFKKKKADLLMSVSLAKPKNWYHKLKSNNRIILNENKIEENTNNYLLNGAIYIYNIKIFKKRIFPKKIYGYVMDKKKSIDIDDQIDFDVAKLAKKKNKFF